MATRQQQITQITRMIREQITSSLAYNSDFTLDDARQVNVKGWTFETRAPLGHTLRHEGVVLTAKELERAYDEAQRQMTEAPF